MESGQRCFHCVSGLHNALVDYRGDVSTCEVLMDNDRNGTIGNLRDYDMDFARLWNGRAANHARAMVNRHEACEGCTHETMGYLPSLLFSPNRLGAVFGSGSGPQRICPEPRPTAAPATGGVS